jgi:hypothetical protein
MITPKSTNEHLKAAKQKFLSARPTSHSLPLCDAKNFAARAIMCQTPIARKAERSTFLKSCFAKHLKIFKPAKGFLGEVPGLRSPTVEAKSLLHLHGPTGL